MGMSLAAEEAMIDEEMERMREEERRAPAADESRRRCARGAADEPPVVPAGMTPEQAARSADQTAAILRALAAAYEAARLDTWIVWYCEPGAPSPWTYDRISDLGDARDLITRVLAMYVAHGSWPHQSMDRDVIQRRERTPYGARSCAYLARAVDHVRAALQGESAEIPSSDGLGPYPLPRT